jgi:hypothetical protein
MHVPFNWAIRCDARHRRHAVQGIVPMIQLPYKICMPPTVALRRGPRKNALRIRAINDRTTNYESETLARSVFSLRHVTGMEFAGARLSDGFDSLAE